MAVEKGIVTKIDPKDRTLAWVTTTRTSSCGHCASKEFCQEKDSRKEMEVQAENGAGAEIGDHVIITLDSGALLKASFLMYVFPIMAMLLGAIIGDRMAPKWGFDPTIFPVITGFLFFGLAILAVRFRSNKMARNNIYQPKITRIAKKHPRPGKTAPAPGTIDHRCFYDPH